MTNLNPLISLCLILSTLFVQAIACTRGQYWYEANNCFSCPVNTFCNDPSGCTPSCTACSTGKTTTYKGATACTDDFTTRCPEGSGVTVNLYTTVPLLRGCYVCEGESKNTEGSLYCDCGPGDVYFTNKPTSETGENSPYCQRCGYASGNNFCPSTLAERIAVGGCIGLCPVCPTGKYSTVYRGFTESFGSVACTDSSTKSCPADSGKIPGQEGCTLCPNDAFNAGDRLYCKCKFFGTFLNEKNICTACPPNTYCGADNTCGGACEVCPAGTESGVKAAACTSATTTTCPRHTGMVSGKTGCFECAAGQFNDGTKLTCQVCPDSNSSADITAPTQGPFCSCKAGYTQTSASSGCSACVTGTYKNNIGNGACTPCAAGKYMESGKVGSTSNYECISCPPGRYASSEVVGGTLAQRCTACAAGKYAASNDVGVLSSSSCINCPVGLTSAEGSVSVSSCGCPAGEELVASACIACPVGKYKLQIGSFLCATCPLGMIADTTGSVSCRLLQNGYYSKDGVQSLQCPVSSFVTVYGNPSSDEELRGMGSVNIEKGQTCQPCLYPMESNCRITQTVNYNDPMYEQFSFPRCEACSLAHLNANDEALTAVMVVMAITFFGLFFFMHEKGGTVQWRQVLGLMGYLVIPVMDMYTDMIFILTNEFVSKAVLISSILAFCLPNLLILHLLYNRNALWPALPIAKPTCLDFGDVANIYIAGFSCILLSPIMFLNTCMCLFKLLVGMFLFGTKSLCIGNVANWWFKWWTGNDDHEMDEAIDTEILNESLYVEIVCETLPQVVLQLFNNYKLDSNVAQWSTVSKISLSLSFMNTLNGLYQFVYFKFVKRKTITDLSVNVSVLGIKLLNAPATKHEITMKRNINRREAEKSLLSPSNNFVVCDDSQVSALPISSSLVMDGNTSIEMVSIHGNISSTELQELLSEHNKKVQCSLTEHDIKVQGLLFEHDRRAQHREDALFEKLLDKIRALIVTSGESLILKTFPQQGTPLTKPDGKADTANSVWRTNYAESESNEDEEEKEIEY